VHSHITVFNETFVFGRFNLFLTDTASGEHQNGAIPWKKTSVDLSIDGYRSNGSNNWVAARPARL